jgi:hypothetical protein
VSYAHRDETQTTTLQRGCGLPSAFWKQLQLLARSLQRRGIDLSPAQVFFDQERLKTVDRWTVAIEQALQECEVFIFLVSANSLDSPFCMERELQQAVLRGVPVVPVLLTRVHGWGDQGPSGIPSFRLGHCHSGGLPKGPDANALPVSHWSHEDDAWARVCADLDTLLSERLATTGSPASPPKPVMPWLAAPAPVAAGTAATATPAAVDGAAPQSVLPMGAMGVMGMAGPAAAPSRTPPPTLLPYFCNQTAVLDRFEEDLIPWNPLAQDQALLVLAKGTYEDGLEPFLDRLRRDYLLNHSKAPVRDTQLTAVLGWVGSVGRDDERLVCRMAANLYQALGLPRDEAFSSGMAPLGTAAVESALRRQNSVTYLWAQLPEELGPREAGASVRALLTFLERGTAAGVLGRLEIVLSIATPDLVKRPQLRKDWKLKGFAKTHVVELAPLVPIDRAAAAHWHLQHRLEERFGLSQPEFLDETFNPESSRYRMRNFGDAVGKRLNALATRITPN